MISDLIQQFNTKSNPDFILESNGEFLIATDVDSSLLAEYQKNILSSYDQNIFTNLTNRLQGYLDKKYEPSSASNYIEKKFELGNTLNPSYKRIFYYAKLNNLFLKTTSVTENQLKAVRDNKFRLDFEPTESDKQQIILKSMGVPKPFRDWYMSIGENIQQGLDNLLISLNKKGTWTKQSENIISTSIDLTYVKENILIPQFEFIITDFFNKNQTQNTLDLLITKESYLDDIAIFYKLFNEQSTSKKYYLFGFPKSLIDQFPNLSVATDYAEFKVNNIVSYDNLQDLRTSINSLKTNISKKQQSLSDGSLKISNYDPTEYLKRLDSFVLAVVNAIELNKLDSNSGLSFKFIKNECPPNSTEPVEKAVHDKCVQDLVDGQTNLSLISAVSQDKTEIKNLSSISIDNTVAAYLFCNAKSISKVAKDYSAKDFFSKLIYKKTKFEKEEGLTIKTFLDAAETSAQQSFVSEISNLAKFSKIKQNIEKQNFSQKSISQNIKDVLSEIQNLKQLYESILYRYDLKDLVDELLKCFLTNNPNINAAAIAIKTLIEGIIKVLDYTDPNYVKLIQCTGASLPLSFGNIKIEDIAAGVDVTIPFKDALNAVLDLPDVNADYVSTTIIKCADQFAPPEVKQIIDTYIQSEATRKALKQQYDQLVIEAKAYKSAPGTEDAKNKRAIGFLKKAGRNAWILLQRQAEKEAERLIKEAAIEIIKSLLKDANNCKPSTDKNKNNNKPLGSPGDLYVSVGAGEVNDLLDLLSKLFNPEQLCSLFYGSADDELYFTVLNFIKNNFPSLYSTTQPIKVDNITVSTQSLSSIFAIKQFFIVLSTELPQFTKIKCDNYFENLSNSPLPINDDDKCIDFSKQYEEKKKQELINKGFTEAQANKIIENAKSIQSDKYKNLQALSENGVYNEITKKSEDTVYPVAPMVKEKIEKQLISLINSFSNFVSIYKNELISLIKVNTKLSLGENEIFYDFTLNQIVINGYKISFKSSNNMLETIFIFSQGDFQFFSDNYSLYKDYPMIQIQNYVKDFLLSKVLSTKINSEILKLNDKNDVEARIPFSLINFLNISTSEIDALYKQKFDSFAISGLNQDKILTDVKELLYFEEQ